MNLSIILRGKIERKIVLCRFSFSFPPNDIEIFFKQRGKKERASRKDIGTIVKTDRQTSTERKREDVGRKSPDQVFARLLHAYVGNTCFPSTSSFRKFSTRVKVVA